MSMKPFATNIAEQQYERLKVLARRLGVTQSELVRRFLDDGLEREERRQDEREARTATRLKETEGWQ
jgi:hypothetical protein